jgi:hypothetical protein
MKAALLCTVALLIFGFSAFGQVDSRTKELSSDISFFVRDAAGAAVSNAYVLIHSDSLERGDSRHFHLELRTSLAGTARGQLPPGFFDVFIASPGMSPHCLKIRVRDGKPAKITAALKLDRLYVEEYGDDFSMQDIVPLESPKPK